MRDPIFEALTPTRKMLRIFRFRSAKGPLDLSLSALQPRKVQVEILDIF